MPSAGTPAASSLATSPPTASASTALAAAFEHPDPVVGLDAVGAGLEQVPVEVAQGRRSACSSSSKASLLSSTPPSSSRSRAKQRGARRQRLAVLVVDGDGDLAGPRQRRHQLELLLGQVVESVQEHRARAPGARSLAQADRDLANGGMGIVASGRVTAADIGLVEPSELGLVGAFVELGGRACQLAGGDQARLKLGDQALQRGGEPASGRGARQRLELGLPHGRADQGEPLRVRELGTKLRPRSAPASSWVKAAKVRMDAPRAAAFATPPSRDGEQSSRSKRSASSSVGTTRTGSRSSAASRRARISPARPEFGGPTIKARGIARSIGRVTARVHDSGARGAPPRP